MTTEIDIFAVFAFELELQLSFPSRAKDEGISATSSVHSDALGTDVISLW